MTSLHCCICRDFLKTVRRLRLYSGWGISLPEDGNVKMLFPGLEMAATTDTATDDTYCILVYALALSEAKDCLTYGVLVGLDNY